MFYENYLNSIKPDMSFIPESASFKDASIFTERSIQDAFNEAFIGLAMNEMTMFEKALNEADENASEEAKKKDPSAFTKKRKEILDTVKKCFHFIWGKIKGFWATVVDKVKEIYTKFKVEKGKVIEKDFNSSLEKLAKARGKDDKFANSIYEKKSVDALHNAKVDFGKVVGMASNSLQDFVTMIGNGGDEFFEKYSKENMYIELANINSLVKYEPKQNATLNDVIKAKADIISLVFKQDSIIKDIKENYNKAKKTVDECMNNAKDIVNKDMDVKAYLKIVSNFATTLTKTQSAYLAEAKKIRSNYVGIVSKVIVATKRTVKEDTEITIDVHEDPEEDTKVEVNAEPESSADVKDELEEAFNALLEEEDEVKAAEDSAEGDKVDDKAAPEAVKEEDEVDVEVDSEDDDAPVDESTDLYRALVNYLD